MLSWQDVQHIIVRSNYISSDLSLFFFLLSSMLSWRDVQHIIVRSTRHYPVKKVPESHWTENKAGFKGELKEEGGKSCTCSNPISSYLNQIQLCSTKVVSQKCKSVRHNPDWYYG